MIQRYKPDVFIYEQVKNFKNKPHIDVKNLLVKKLKSITRICPGKTGSKNKKRRVYHLTEKVLKTCEVVSSCIEKPPPQIRERYFLVGLKKSKKCLRGFAWPKRCSKNSLVRLLRLDKKVMLREDEETKTLTEERNWKSILEEWELNDAGPQVGGWAIADFQASKGYGINFQVDSCPTITKARCEASAFWLVLRPSQKEYVKRRLSDQEYALLQGWPKEDVKQMLKLCGQRTDDLLTRNEFRRALGNGFSYNCMQAIIGSIVDLIVNSAKKSF